MIIAICLIILQFSPNIPASIAEMKGIEKIKLESLDSYNRTAYYDENLQKFVFADSPERFAKEKSPVHEYHIWHAPTASVGQPWPKPQSISISNQFTPVSDNPAFKILDKNCELINLAIERYKKRIFSDKSITHVSVDSIYNKINSCKKSKFIETCTIEKISISVEYCFNGEIPSENMDESLNFDWFDVNENEDLLNLDEVFARNNVETIIIENTPTSINEDVYEVIFIDDDDMIPATYPIIILDDNEEDAYLSNAPTSNGDDDTSDDDYDDNDGDLYQIRLSQGNILISSHQTWGLLRGLETLAQLMFVVVDSDYNWLAIGDAKISDNPKYKHRGLMIDTSRHFIPISKLLENLNGMEMNKLNVFHWHISDDQSFPFQSKSHPELYIKGAFHINMTYSYNQIRNVVEYARQRGIRVIPEIDVPGHTSSWEKSNYELLTECKSLHRGKKKFYGPLNPILEETYLFLKDLYTELFLLFPDTHVHIGLDEVGKGCWATDPRIKDFMKKNQIENVELLLVLFIHKLQLMINLNFPKKTLIVWEEASEKNNNLTKNTVIQIWRSRVDNFHHIKKGHPIIYSTSYYLDHATYGASWVQFYVNDFENYLNLNYVGGEACMWNEFQSKETISQNIWPAMCAIAEILWFGKRNFLIAASQLEEQRCRMLRNGISVGVGSGPSECLYLPDDIHISFNLSCHYHTFSLHGFPKLTGILKASLMFVLGFMTHFWIQMIIRHKKKIYSNLMFIVLLLITCLYFLYS